LTRGNNKPEPRGKDSNSGCERAIVADEPADWRKAVADKRRKNYPMGRGRCLMNEED
jgi:hypothetical protein